MKQLIVQNSKILGGKPIIIGTRISVEIILELLSSGMEISDILKEYPMLTKEKIKAAIDYAAKIMGKEESYIFNKPKTHEVPGGR